MPEIAGALNAASLFAGVIGLLFGSWMSDINAVLGRTLPIHYSDRKIYFNNLVDTFFLKSLPLTIILISFNYAFLVVFLSVAGERKFYNIFAADSAGIDMEVTIFGIIAVAMAYFLAISFISSVRILKTWVTARKGRKVQEPRVHVLG